MKFDLVGGTYQAKYKDYNPERSINWYPVSAKNLYKSYLQLVVGASEKDKSPTALFPHPGSSSFATISGVYNRGLYAARSGNQYRCFTVVDQTLNEISTNGVVTN